MHKNDSPYDYVSNDFTLHELSYDADVTLSVELQKPLRIPNLKRFPHNNP